MGGVEEEDVKADESIRSIEDAKLKQVSSGDGASNGVCVEGGGRGVLVKGTNGMARWAL